MKKLILAYFISFSCFTLASSKDEQLLIIAMKFNKYSREFRRCRARAGSQMEELKCFYLIADKLSEIGNDCHRVNFSILYKPACFIIGDFIPFVIREQANRLG